MFKLIRITIVLTFSLIIIAFIVPFFVDKQKFVKLAEEKINSELKANISFDEDVNLTLLPFPTLKINSLKYFDKKLDLQIKEIKISITWSSIFDLKPEVTNMEILSPSLKVRKDLNSAQNEKFKIFVNNKNEYFYDKLKKLSDKFEIIKIRQGLVQFEKAPNLGFDNFNAIVKGKERLSINGNLALKKLNSEVIFDGFQVKDNQFNLIMQKKINGKNKLDFIGQVNLIKNDFLLNGEIKSDFLNLDELLSINKQLVSFNRSDPIHIGTQKQTKKVNFRIKKLLVSNVLLEDTEFSVMYQHPNFEIQSIVASFEGAKITGMSLVNLSNNKVNGNLNLKNFHVKESYFGKTKYDLLDGQVNCNLVFDYLIGKNQNNLKTVVSNGNCKTGRIKLKGLDIDKVVNDVDNIKDFATLVNVINPRVLKGSSVIQFIEFNFFVENGKFKIKKGKAFHNNVELNSFFGSFNLLNNDINLKNKAYIKTSKFKKLPPLGINISGKIDNYSVKYNFEDLKEELFNKSVKKILDESKSIIIDPNEIKKMFNNKNFNPNSILDLFEN